MEQSKRIYLACPYSHNDESIRQLRYENVTMKAAELMAAGYIVFSPISHSHPIAGYLPSIIVTNFDFWMQQDLHYIKLWADELWVLCLPGWKESPGVMLEIERAFDANIPVRLLKY